MFQGKGVLNCCCLALTLAPPIFSCFIANTLSVSLLKSLDMKNLKVTEQVFILIIVNLMQEEWVKVADLKPVVCMKEDPVTVDLYRRHAKAVKQ